MAALVVRGVVLIVVAGGVDSFARTSIICSVWWS